MHSKKYMIALFDDLEQHQTPLYAEPLRQADNQQLYFPTFDVRLDAKVLEDTTTGEDVRVWRIRVVQRNGQTIEAMQFLIDRVKARLDPNNTSIEAENNAIVIT